MTDLRKIIKRLDPMIRNAKAHGDNAYAIELAIIQGRLEMFVQELKKDQFRKMCCDEKSNGWAMAIQRVIGKEVKGP